MHFFSNLVPLELPLKHGDFPKHHSELHLIRETAEDSRCFWIQKYETWL